MPRVQWMQWLRTLHAYSALVLGVAVIFYASSGFVMIHGDRFIEHPNGTNNVQQIEFDKLGRSLASSGRDVAPQLIEHIRSEYGHHLDIAGVVNYAHRRDDGLWNLNIGRPSRLVQIEIDPKGPATIQEQDFGPLRSYARLHETMTYDGSIWNIVWAIIVDLTAVSMLVFAITGIAMWWMRGATRVGALCLFFGLSYPLVSIVYFFWIA